MENESFMSFFDRDGGWHEEKRPGNRHYEEEHLLDDHDFRKVLNNCLDALPEKWSFCVKSKFLTEKSGEKN